MICNKLLRDKADLRNFLTLHAKRCLEHFALKARTRYVIAQARLPHFKLGEPLLDARFQVGRIDGAEILSSIVGRG